MTNQSSMFHPRLRWDSATPISDHFDDMYFNIDQGIAETTHVFINGNGLQQRFSSLEFSRFCIAETGFGTGLNFLVARQLWLEKAPPQAQLHFISVEKFPLRRADLTKALTAWPELKDGADQLIENYPIASDGFHRLSFDDGSIKLTLMLGDAAECYSLLEAEVDAWFLDGFAPSKNPDMWNPALFEQMGRLSKQNTSFATFTAAGFVRRGLSEVGFAVKKVPGFGRKREMAVGYFQSQPEAIPLSQPWYSPPIPTHIDSAIVIGAGIAGCSTAYALARRGIRVTVLERHSEPATEGSGNRQGALYAKLPAESTKQGSFHQSGLNYTISLLNQAPTAIWNRSGLLLVAHTNKEAKRQQLLLDNQTYPESVIAAVSQDEASELAGTNISAPALWMEQAGWVSPRDLCKHLLDHPNIRLVTDTTVRSIEHVGDHWQLDTNNSNYSADAVVIASASESIHLSQSSHIPIKKIRGQVSTSKTTKGAKVPKCVVCGEGYVSPPLEDKLCYGASFKLRDQETSIRDSEHAENFDRLTQILPEVAENLAPPNEGKVGFRCATPDYMPIIGAVPVHESFCRDYRKLSKDAKSSINTPPTHFPGLYISVGHGSKGLITAPLGGEIIASQILGEPLPVGKEILDALNPARFIIKNLIKGTI